MLSSSFRNISNAIDRAGEQMPFNRKSTIFSNQVAMDTKMMEISILLLENKIPGGPSHHAPDLDWHNLEHNRSFIADGAFLTAARKSMVSNITQLPIIVAQHTQKNRLGLPLYFPTYQTQVTTKTPEMAVYIGIKTII
jgi:hypothetical protein